MMGLEPTTFCMANPGGTLPEAKLREYFGLPEPWLLVCFWLASAVLRVVGVGVYGCARTCDIVGRATVSNVALPIDEFAPAGIHDHVPGPLGF